MRAVITTVLLIAVQCCTAIATAAPHIQVQSPMDYQVFQRRTRLGGMILIKGVVAEESAKLEYRIVGEPLEGRLAAEWQPVPMEDHSHGFRYEIATPAGGWYQLELRAGANEVQVGHVGVGEVFVVAGQSNSTNYGAAKLKTKTKEVATFDGAIWRLADDPQPGTADHSGGGSCWPAFGDAMHEKFKVPIGVASTGCGATSVRQWLMKGEKIAVHPTLDNFVKAVGPDQWECTGELYDGMIRRMAALGPRGFRGVLWHQGESDAGQAREGYPANRQITGEQYRAVLETIIRSCRKDAGWDVPWFVAQATFHSEKDAADAEFRAVQKSLWVDGIALEGPDTDALRGVDRAGVHFSESGQIAHGKLWAAKVGVYLDKVLAVPTTKP